jgi:ribose/xylose/arabinose/galactoside ABC-type transport system permease subunit
VASNVAVRTSARSRAGALVGGFARSRELTLGAVIIALSALVATRAPNFLLLDNLQPVTTLAAIIAIAAVGEAFVILTKNIDLSVESTIGIVAFVVGLILKEQALPVPAAWAVGIGLGLVLGMSNGVIVAFFRVPSIVATLGTLSIFRGLCFLVANGKEINLNDLPDGYTNAASQNFFGAPLFVLLAVVVVIAAALLLRYTVLGRLFYAVGSNAEAAATIGVRSQFTVFLAFGLSGMLAGLAGVLWGINYGAIYANSASGQSLAVIAAVVVGGVSIAGGSGTVVGAALGALFLGLINNALLLLLLPQEWLQMIYGAVILLAVSTDALIQVRTQRAKARSRIR